jgi:hypothetical protein
MDVIRLVLAAVMVIGAGVGGGALSVAVVDLIWPASTPSADRAVPASRAVVVKGDRLDRADITCWSIDGKASKCH